MSLYVFKLWSEFGRLQVYSSLTLAKYKHYFWKLNETARWVHIHTKPSLKAEAFGVYDEWQTGKTFISDSLFSPLAAQLASANLQNPPFIGIMDRISALVYLMQPIASLRSSASRQRQSCGGFSVFLIHYWRLSEAFCFPISHAAFGRITALQ